MCCHLSVMRLDARLCSRAFLLAFPADPTVSVSLSSSGETGQDSRTHTVPLTAAQKPFLFTGILTRERYNGVMKNAPVLRRKPFGMSSFEKSGVQVSTLTEKEKGRMNRQAKLAAVLMLYWAVGGSRFGWSGSFPGSQV